MVSGVVMVDSYALGLLCLVPAVTPDYCCGRGDTYFDN